MSEIFKILNRRLRLLISRGVLAETNDVLKTQNVKMSLLDDETVDEVEYFQNYGHTSVPPAGSEGLVLSVGGKRQHLIAIAVGDKLTRLNNLKTGDSALYHLEGHAVVLTENGEINITCTKLTIDAATINLNGNVTVSGDLTVSGTSSAADHTSGGISGKNHQHPNGNPNTGTPL